MVISLLNINGISGHLLVFFFSTINISFHMLIRAWLNYLKKIIMIRCLNKIKINKKISLDKFITTVIRSNQPEKFFQIYNLDNKIGII